MRSDPLIQKNQFSVTPFKKNRREMSITRNAVSVWDRLGPLAAPRTRMVLGVVTFAVLTALSAKLSILVPGTTVPFTFQPLVVLLGGALMGAGPGAASATLYLLSGSLGMPVFALPGAGIGYLLGPTGGYLLAYPAAAFIAGSLVAKSHFRNLVAFLAGFAVIYAGGLAWLTILGGWSTAVVLGLKPFVLADLVKVVLGVAITAGMRDRARSTFGA